MGDELGGLRLRRLRTGREDPARQRASSTGPGPGRPDADPAGGPAAHRLQLLSGTPSAPPAARSTLPHPGWRGRAATPPARRIKFVGSRGAGRRGEGAKLLSPRRAAGGAHPRRDTHVRAPGPPPPPGPPAPLPPPRRFPFISASLSLFLSRSVSPSRVLLAPFLSPSLPPLPPPTPTPRRHLSLFPSSSPA